MTEEQKKTIMRLRDKGLGYQKIGIALDIPRDKVCNYCKAKGMDGYAKRLIEKKEWKQMKRRAGKSYVDSAAIQLKLNSRWAEVCVLFVKAQNGVGQKHPALYKYECLF